MGKIKQFSSVSALIIFNGFSHALDNFQLGFYLREVKLQDGSRVSVRKTRGQITNDIYSMVKDLYPGTRYSAVNITFHA